MRRWQWSRPIISATRGAAAACSSAQGVQRVSGSIHIMKEAPTEAAFLQAGYDFQGYVTGTMLTCGLASLPFLQAARADINGYVYLHGYKVQFETTWLDRP